MQTFCQTPLGRGLGSPLRTTNGRLQKQQRSITCPKAEGSPNGSGKTTSGKKEKLYLGKGRYIEDDPEKYPRKENGLGIFTGISGGWAGGEVGLKEFTKDFTKEAPKATSSKAKSEAVNAKFMGRDVQATKVGQGNDTLYIGWKTGSQEDLLSKRAGNMGRFIIDDAKKYPSKESWGVFNGLTGGFAGGERGVKQFVEEGDISFTETGIGGREWSPVVVATIVAGVGSAGTILLTNIFDISKGLVTPEMLNAPLDDNTKTLLEAALVFLGLAAGGAGFVLFRTLADKLISGAKGATKVIIGAGFWLVVLVAAFQIAHS